MTRRTRLVPIGVLGIVLLLGTACAKGGDKGSANDRPGSAPPAAAPTGAAAGIKPESEAPAGKARCRLRP